MASGHLGRVIVLGVPAASRDNDAGRCSEAPAVMRAMTDWLGLRQGFIFDQVSRSRKLTEISISDAGNMPLQDGETPDHYLKRLSAVIQAIRKTGKNVLVLGGNHLITMGVINGLCAHKESFQILQIDAHSDVQKIGPDSKPSNGNFVSYAANNSAIRQWLQLGVRVPSLHEPVYPSKVINTCLINLRKDLIPGVPIYITIDTDGFDPSVMPAVDYPFPGGLSVNDLSEVLDIITSANCPFLGADWVEYATAHDFGNRMTACAIMDGLIRLLSFIELNQREYETFA
nr:arginase family protein [Sphingomonas sp. ABOLH]